VTKPRYEVFEGADGQHYWHLIAANGEILASSEAYETAEHAREGVEAAEEAAAAAESDRDALAEALEGPASTAEDAAGEVPENEA
jgi:uncharacterized protein YegP (UPF0339 family)